MESRSISQLPGEGYGQVLSQCPTPQPFVYHLQKRCPFHITLYPYSLITLGVKLMNNNMRTSNITRIHPQGATRFPFWVDPPPLYKSLQGVSPRALIVRVWDSVFFRQYVYSESPGFVNFAVAQRVLLCIFFFFARQIGK